MHREMKIYFPEYKDALGKVDGAFSLELLKSAPFPADLKALDENGIRQIWHEAKLRGRGYSRSGEILGYARRTSIRSTEMGMALSDMYLQSVISDTTILSLVPVVFVLHWEPA